MFSKPLLQTLIKTSSLALVIKLAGAIFAFYVHYLLANKLTTSDYGLFSVFAASLLFSSTFLKQGLENAIAKTFAITPSINLPHVYIWVCGFIVLNFLCFIFLVIFAGKWFFTSIIKQPELNDYLMQLSVLSLLQCFLLVNSSVLRGLDKTKLSMLFSGTLSYLLFVLVLFFYSDISLYQAIKFQLVAVIGSLFVSYLFLFKQLPSFSLPLRGYELSGASTLFKLQKHLAIGVFAALLSQQAAIFIIAANVSTAEVALYAVALKFAVLMSYPLLVINSILGPKFAKAFHRKKINDLKLYYKQSVLLSGISGLLLFGLILLFGKSLLMLFGEEYKAAHLTLIILAFGQLVNMLTGSVTSLLVMTGNEKFHKRHSIVSSIGGVILLLVITPIYGSLGAAAVTTFVMITFNLVNLHYINKKIFLLSNNGNLI